MSENVFNEKEFLDICNELGAEPKVREITIEYASEGYFNKMKEAVGKDRRGEVVFCVKRPGGKFITVRSKEYPAGIFRIPTGGIGHRENIVEAVFRETKEELGLETSILSFEGVLKTRFQHGKEHVMFYSYLFIMEEKGGKLLEDATDDEVSEIREVDLTQLKETALELLKIENRWKDWGKFRYESTNAIAECLS